MRYLVRKFLLIITIILGWINVPAQAFLLSDQQDLWPVMSQTFTIPVDTDKADIQNQIDTDLSHPKYLHKLTENARPYLYYIFQETKKKHLPAELALLPMIESEYTPSGRSSKGAVGLWQLMPSTAHNYGIKMNTWYDGRQSTIVSTKAALNFLSYLYEQFDHNWLLALAAYNAGPGAVMAAIHDNERHGRPTDFWALHLPKQTEQYIPKLLALAEIIQHPKEYGIRLSPVPNKPVTSTVTIQKQMPLKTIATMAHTSVSTVKKLNPALKREVTPPHQIVTVVLPANKKPEFEKQIAKKKVHHHVVQHKPSLLVPKVITQTAKEITVAEKKEVTPPAATKSDDTTVATNSHEHEYTVKRGDNLHRLAERFDTTTYHIMRHNHLKHAALSVGQHLLLPNA